MDRQVSLEGYTPEQINNLAALSVELSKDPTTVRDFHRIIRKVNPEFVSPTLDSDDRLQAATKPLADKYAKLEEQLQREQAQKRLDELRASAMREGVSESEIKDGSFEKWATEQGFGITQLAQAARLRRAENQLAVPVAQDFNLRAPGFTEADATEMRKNPMKWFDKQTHAAVADVLSARRSPA